VRQLSDDELSKIEFLTSKQIEVALIEPTKTGLRKSIMDATSSVRDFLKLKNIHDFNTQKQGPTNKIVLDTVIIDIEQTVTTRTSLYRPTTKMGDPRVWISKIGSLCSAGDILAISSFEGRLWVFNLTTLPIRDLFTIQSPFKHFVDMYSAEERGVSDELIEKIRAIARKGYIKSPFKGDTAIGRLLETELGIVINSSKDPDYKGIEIKSSRAERQNRKNLFAQVPDWDISTVKSSRTILDQYGYLKDGVRRLYCTVTSTRFNPQTLRLKVDSSKGLLTEYSSRDGDVVSWRFRNLEQRLLTKHKETFWVEALSKIEDGQEYFKFTKIEHTKDPLASQLGILIQQGQVSLDHLIKEKGVSAVEKGPIFKLKKNSLPLLFPPSEIYVLADE